MAHLRQIIYCKCIITIKWNWIITRGLSTQVEKHWSSLASLQHYSTFKKLLCQVCFLLTVDFAIHSFFFFLHSASHNSP